MKRVHYPAGKFFVYRPIGKQEMYIVTLRTRHGYRYCDSEARPWLQALEHFWRWIGAA